MASLEQPRRAWLRSNKPFVKKFFVSAGRARRLPWRGKRASLAPVKRTPVIAAVAATILIAALFWRQNMLEGELASLRSALKNIPPPAKAAPIANQRVLLQNAPQPAAADRSPAQAEERIADLERVANGHADLIEELMRKFDDMEFARQKSRAPGWNVLQAIGPPDTMSDGDQPTAWAPAQPDGGEEWLVAEFAQPVEVAQVVVRETCGPGCITKITSVTDAGVEVVLWQGEPPKNASPSNTVFAVLAGTTTARIKVHLDTKRVPGWNEIDAVQLVGRDGSRQWARNASASSSYGGGSAITLGFERLTSDQFGTTIEIMNSLERKGTPTPRE